jgi:Protein of unknown function
MTGTSNADLDALLLSSSKTQWQKVAMIVSIVYFEYRHNGIDVSVDAVADRIRSLVEDGKLQAQGDLSKMRHSEVKLPD